MTALGSVLVNLFNAALALELPADKEVPVLILEVRLDILFNAPVETLFSEEVIPASDAGGEASAPGALFTIDEIELIPPGIPLIPVPVLADDKIDDAEGNSDPPPTFANGLEAEPVKAATLLDTLGSAPPTVLPKEPNAADIFPELAADCNAGTSTMLPIDDLSCFISGVSACAAAGAAAAASPAACVAAFF